MIFKMIQSGGKNTFSYLFYGGLNLLLIAFLLFVFPKVLSYVLGGIIAIAGFGMVYWAIKMKLTRSGKKDDSTTVDYYEIS